VIPSSILAKSGVKRGKKGGGRKKANRPKTAKGRKKRCGDSDCFLYHLVIFAFFQRGGGEKKKKKRGERNDVPRERCNLQSLLSTTLNHLEI